jgi:hypothetical protein
MESVARLSQRATFFYLTLADVARSIRPVKGFAAMLASALKRTPTVNANLASLQKCPALFAACRSALESLQQHLGDDVPVAAAASAALLSAHH